MDILMHLKILTMLSVEQSKEYISNLKDDELRDVLQFIRKIESVINYVDEEYDHRTYEE